MRSLFTPDGRTLAYELGGDPGGVPVVYQHGVPGSRLRQPLDRGLWARLGVRAVTYDRPGYGGSTPLSGRTVADCAADVAALADELSLERFCVLGVSGGGPHALAVATLAPERVAAAALVVPAAPVVPEELDRLIPVNRASYERARTGGAEAIAEQILPLREQVLADPVGTIGAMLGDDAVRTLVQVAPDAVERAAAAIVEGLRPGPEGWIDDSLAIELRWGFEPRPVGCATSVWLAADDTATPASAVRRLAESIRARRVEEWHGAGHLSSVLREADVLEDLLEAAR